MLPLGEVADRRQQHGDIALLLLLHDRGRMLSGCRQMDARIRALNLDEALGPAADRADARPQGRALATPFPADRMKGTSSPVSFAYVAADQATTVDPSDRVADLRPV